MTTGRSATQAQQEDITGAVNAIVKATSRHTVSHAEDSAISAKATRVFQRTRERRDVKEAQRLIAALLRCEKPVDEVITLAITAAELFLSGKNAQLAAVLRERFRKHPQPAVTGIHKVLVPTPTFLVKVTWLVNSAPGIPGSSGHKK